MRSHFRADPSGITGGDFPDKTKSRDIRAWRSPPPRTRAAFENNTCYFSNLPRRDFKPAPGPPSGIAPGAQSTPADRSTHRPIRRAFRHEANPDCPEPGTAGGGSCGRCWRPSRNTRRAHRPYAHLALCRNSDGVCAGRNVQEIHRGSLKRAPPTAGLAAFSSLQLPLLIERVCSKLLYASAKTQPIAYSFIWKIQIPPSVSRRQTQIFL